jgi:Lamin Tail Domain/Collagen triple helix repeat (20 copies)
VRSERAVSWRVRGPAGPAGAAGRTGSAGATGAPGAVGPRGEAGPTGPRGPEGRRGADGSRGPKGDPGTLASFEALAGLPCQANAHAGTIALAFDGAGRASFTCVPSVEAPSVRVNEVETGTSASGADEFVELVNSGGEAVAVGGFRLVYRSGTGTSDVALATIPPGTTIPAGGFYLIGGSAYGGSRHANQSFTAGLASNGGGVALRGASGDVVDSIGWGTATNAFIEGRPAAPPPATAPPGSSAGRLPDGRDTNDNAADFSVSSAATPGEPNRGG